jgi:hypothetical protein
VNFPIILKFSQAGFLRTLGFPQLFKNCLLQPTLAQLSQTYFYKLCLATTALNVPEIIKILWWVVSWLSKKELKF